MTDSIDPPDTIDPKPSFLPERKEMTLQNRMMAIRYLAGDDIQVMHNLRATVSDDFEVDNSEIPLQATDCVLTVTEK